MRGNLSGALSDQISLFAGPFTYPFLFYPFLVHNIARCLGSSFSDEIFCLMKNTALLNVYVCTPDPLMFRNEAGIPR